MTEEQIGVRLARIEAQLAHIDRALTGPPPMSERVALLEERMRGVIGLPKQVQDGKEHDAITDAVTEERTRVRNEARKNIAAVAAIASLIATAGSGAIWAAATYFNGSP